MLSNNNNNNNNNNNHLQQRLLSKRLELVQLMFGADTLKADWEQELSHLTDARLSLLVERREMVGALDGQPTRAPPSTSDTPRRTITCNGCRAQ